MSKSFLVCILFFFYLQTDKKDQNWAKQLLNKYSYFLMELPYSDDSIKNTVLGPNQQFKASTAKMA